MTTIASTNTLAISLLDDDAVAAPAVAIAPASTSPTGARAVSTVVAVQRTNQRRHVQAARARRVNTMVFVPIGAAALIGLVYLSMMLISYFSQLP
jgi:hypothetical protein